MKETVYMIISRAGVQGTRKSMVDAKRGEVVVKLNIEMPDTAFKPPILEQNVYIEDFRHGIDIEDVQFKNGIITEGEAETIRQNRIAKMKAILESQNYVVTKAEDEDDDTNTDND